MEWLRQQGPWCPALLEYLERNHQQYDVLIFFTYLYAPTVLGVRIAPHKSILVPTAHDEPAIRLEIYKEMFSAAAGLAYNTEVERRFLTTHFSIARSRRRPSAAASTCRSDARRRTDPARRRPRTISTAPDVGRSSPTRIDSPTFRPHLAARRAFPPPAPAARPVRCSTADASIPARAARS